MVKNKYIIYFIVFLWGAHAFAQEIAFPSAEGFGKYATGGRDGKILFVTNLNDSGEGSLREALEQKYPRIILFKVSGTIQLESQLDIKHGNISVLGQSAPGDGIAIRNYPIKATDVDNVIIRYIRSRLGDTSGFQGDAISINHCSNVIVDHCTFSWSVDESASVYDNDSTTVQYCMVTESLNNSVHKKGDHGFGGIWGGRKATFHHNLFAHHRSRNPRFQGDRYHKQPEKEIVDFRNNVIYNWGGNNSYGGEEGNHNIVNNYYKAGPATRSKKDKILDPYEPLGRFYVSGNILVGDEEVNENNWEGVNHFEDTPEIKLDEPIDVEPIITQTAEQAYKKVILEAGCSYQRDDVDRRIIEEVKKGNAKYGTGIIDSQEEVGGWPLLETKSIAKDSDGDAIPDNWELENGLDPKANDSMDRSLNPDYVNLEVYLNGLLEK